MAKAKKKRKVKVRQSVRLANVKNNAGNIGHRPAMNNAAVIRVKVKEKEQ